MEKCLETRLSNHFQFLLGWPINLRKLFISYLRTRVDTSNNPINEGKFIRGICNRFLLRGIKSQRCLRNLHDYRFPSPRGQTAETRWTKPRSRFPFRFTPLTIHERDQQNNLRDSAAERQASGDTKSGRSLTRTELFNRDINCKLSHRERIPSVRRIYCYRYLPSSLCSRSHRLGSSASFVKSCSKSSNRASSCVCDAKTIYNYRSGKKIKIRERLKILLRENFKS